MQAKYVLRLFIAGKTPRSELYIAKLRSLCENEFSCDYTLEIIDVLERPQLAEEEKIVATPTLIKMLPPPIRSIIGDFSNSEKVLIGIDILKGLSPGSVQQRCVDVCKAS